MFSKWVENNVGKGEIARYEQFLLFPHCFQKACIADTYKPGFVWKRVKSLTPNQLETTMRMNSVQNVWEKRVGKTCGKKRKCW